MRRQSAKLLLAVLSASFTVFVFLNTYEVVLNRDVAFAQSIKKVGVQMVLSGVIQQFSTKPASDNQTIDTDLVRPVDLEIPSLKTRIQLEEGRIVDGAWYARPSMGHYVGLNKDEHGTPIDFLIYMGKSWQTMPNPELIETGMEAQASFHGGQVSTYVISEKKVLTPDRYLVVSKSEHRQIILVIDDPENDRYYGYSMVLKH